MKAVRNGVAMLRTPLALIDVQHPDMPLTASALWRCVKNNPIGCLRRILSVVLCTCLLALEPCQAGAQEPPVQPFGGNNDLEQSVTASSWGMEDYVISNQGGRFDKNVSESIVASNAQAEQSSSISFLANGASFDGKLDGKVAGDQADAVSLYYVHFNVTQEVDYTLNGTTVVGPPPPQGYAYSQAGVVLCAGTEPWCNSPIFGQYRTCREYGFCVDYQGDPVQGGTTTFSASGTLQPGDYNLWSFVSPWTTDWNDGFSDQSQFEMDLHPPCPVGQTMLDCGPGPQCQPTGSSCCMDTVCLPQEQCLTCNGKAACTPTGGMLPPIPPGYDICKESSCGGPCAEGQRCLDCGIENGGAQCVPEGTSCPCDESQDLPFSLPSQIQPDGLCNPGQCFLVCGGSTECADPTWGLSCCVSQNDCTFDQYCGNGMCFPRGTCTDTINCTLPTVPSVRG